MTSLNPVFRISSQLTEAIVLHKPCSRAEAQSQALRMLDLVRIPDARQIMNRFPHELSGGMRQRIMIAMSLACEPTLLIADEPTTALDVTVQVQTLRIIKELQSSLAMGVIFITHDMDVVAEVADQVMVMKKGETVEQGPAKAVLQEPQRPYTRALLAAVPKIGSMHGTYLPDFDIYSGETLALVGETVPSRIYDVDYQAPQMSYMEVGPGHFVATSAIM